VIPAAGGSVRGAACLLMGGSGGHACARAQVNVLWVHMAWVVPMGWSAPVARQRLTLACLPPAGASGSAGAVTITGLTRPCGNPQTVEVVDIQPIPESLAQVANQQSGGQWMALWEGL
jgi:hypothetical protein